MGWLRELFHRDESSGPYVPPDGRLTENPIEPLPAPYSRGAADPATSGLGGFAASRGHIVPGYHEPDRPQDR